MAQNLDFVNLRLTPFGEFRRLTLAVKAVRLPPAERQLADSHLRGQRGDGATESRPLAPALADLARKGLRILPPRVQSGRRRVHLPILR
jgi:hypothetical protein